MINTKFDLSNDNFKQSSGSTLNLSGVTNVTGYFKFESGSTFSLKTDYGKGKTLTSDENGNIILSSDFTTFTGNTQTLYNDTSDYSGFVNGSYINILYNYANRTITLTGDLSYYWLGVKKTLTSPWISSAHTATVGHWFLYSTDGVNFNWSQSSWTYENVLVAHVYYQSTSGATFAIRETHGLMDHHAHEDLHNTVGTWLKSGGQATADSYTANTATNTAVSPSFNTAIIDDEDLSSTISGWSKTSGYTLMYISGTTSVYTMANTTPFLAAGTDQYIYVNAPSTGVLTNGINSRWYNVYQILVPVTSDVTSMKYRMIFLLPQQTFTSLNAAQAEDTRGLQLGSLSSASAEYIIYSRITYVTANGNTNYGKVTIPTNGISYVVGNKFSLLSVAGVSSTNHANLSNLSWTSSGHVGTSNTLASFDANGNTELIAKNVYITGATNAGSGTTIYSGTSIQNLVFNSIVGSGNTNVTKIGNEIVISNVETVETVSRTIFVSTGGSDSSGDGTTLGTAFRNILRAIEDIKDRAEGVTITISLNGIGDFPMGSSGAYDEAIELAKKTFINSSLVFTGVDYTTIESGFTLAKTASRCFAYTLTKSGLTATENQYRGYFATDGTNYYYPVASNAAGSDAFEIELVHTSFATATSIVSLGATITNPSNLVNLLDIGFGTNYNSTIDFSRVNISTGAANIMMILYSTTPVTYTNVVFNSYCLTIGAATNSVNIYPNFARCIFNSLASITTGYFRMYGITTKLTFQYNLFNVPHISSGGIFAMYVCPQVYFIQGNYFIGKTTVAVFNGKMYNIYARAAVKMKDALCLYYPDRTNCILPNEANQTNTYPYWEFENVTNLFGRKPSLGSKLQIEGIYGSLPTNLIEGVTSGYKFVDPKNDIHISVPGIYGEFETGSSTLINNTGTTLTIGNTVQNRSIKFDYTITRGTGYRSGSFNMLYDNTNVYMSPDDFITNGVAEVGAEEIVFSASTSSTNIVLTGTLNNSGNDATLQYNINRIMI